MRRSVLAPQRRAGLPAIPVVMAVAGAIGLGATFLVDRKPPDPLAGHPSFAGRVTRVVDGDTFWISGQATRVRVWGLDAPERTDPGGPLATNTLGILVHGKTLTCHHRGFDAYGRIVGQCFLPDGSDVTAVMIAARAAQEFCRYSHNYYGTCGLW